MDKILEVIKQTVIETSWENCNLLVKDMFTTYIYMNDILISKSEPILEDIYETGDIEDCDITYREFKEFMLQDLKKQF